MKTLALILLTATLCQAQSYQIQTVYFDSLVWETKQFRKCDSVQHLQTLQIDQLNQAVTAGLKSIQLKDSAIDALQASNKAAQREIEAMEELRARQIQTVRARARKTLFVAIVEGVVIVLLIL
jgi:hypothetical protein